MFVSNNRCHHVVDACKLNCFDVENFWVEITNGNKKCVIGGIYRHHSHSSVKQFTSELNCVLSNVTHRRIPCVVAGDVNIDLSTIESNVDTANYVDMVLTNNFTPTILMRTRINPITCTLSDHIYFNYTGGGLKERTKIFSGNFLEDISDHLANYAIVCNMKSHTKPERPFVRNFSQKNRNLLIIYRFLILMTYYLIMTPRLHIVNFSELSSCKFLLAGDCGSWRKETTTSWSESAAKPRRRSDWNSGGTHGGTYYISPTVEAK